MGRAIAFAFARGGGAGAVGGRRAGELDGVAKEIAKAGGRCHAIVCDVSRAQDAESSVREAEDKFGSLNVLVNNAGALHVATVDGTSEEDWDRVMAVNSKGPFLMSKAALGAF